MCYKIKWCYCNKAELWVLSQGRCQKWHSKVFTVSMLPCSETTVGLSPSLWPVFFSRPSPSIPAPVLFFPLAYPSPPQIKLCLVYSTQIVVHLYVLFWDASLTPYPYSSSPLLCSLEYTHTFNVNTSEIAYKSWIRSTTFARYCLGIDHTCPSFDPQSLELLLMITCRGRG